LMFSIVFSTKEIINCIIAVRYVRFSFVQQPWFSMSCFSAKVVLKVLLRKNFANALFLLFSAAEHQSRRLQSVVGS
jgi:hypothetical protein